MPEAPPLWSELELLVYDFDGVMTDNRALIFRDGSEAVFVNRSDGLAVKRLRDLGVPQVIISTETDQVVSTRAEKLQLPVHQGIGNKLQCLREVMVTYSAHPEKTLYIGNDTNDIEAMRFVAWPIAPADAHHDVLEVARVITQARGGEGVIREVVDLLSVPSVGVRP